ncbi:MAG: hypothetical protein A6F72_00440 [Cycloclasticus sp. symbiont of Poecilosclerida sp. N]|nr:MAG: hypothetical protein A6F72_00440 [Cycloclasticus sp. symbiont of Poecilosclerida sp. N]
MSNGNVVAFKKRDETGDLIKELLEERKQVWALYCTVSGIEEYVTSKSLEEFVQALCQLANWIELEDELLGEMLA